MKRFPDCGFIFPSLNFFENNVIETTRSFSHGNGDLSYITVNREIGFKILYK